MNDVVKIETYRKDVVTLDASVFSALLQVKKRFSKINQDGAGYPAFTAIDGSNVILHRWVYATFVAEIPEGMHIHHIDGNILNACISNLRLVSLAEHSRIHRLGVGEDKIPYIIKRKLSYAVKRFEFRLFIKRKLISKRFHTLEEAIAYRDETLPKYGIPPVEGRE